MSTLQPVPTRKSNVVPIVIVVVVVGGLSVLVTGALLVALLLPAVFGAMELANRASCANNLSQIGKAGHAYAAAHREEWPKALSDMDSRWDDIGNTRADQVKAGDLPTATRSKAVDDGAGTKPQSNTCNLWTLVAQGYLTPQTCICPSGGHVPDDTVTDFATVRDFRGPNYVSYSFQNCWGSYRLTSTSSTNSSQFAIVADANPQRADFTRKGGATAKYLATQPAFVQEAWRGQAVSGAWELNSPNHAFKGQNVLYLDGHVEWQDHPYCGVRCDNIWVIRKEAGGDIDAKNVDTLRAWADPQSYDDTRALPPDSADDSFLVP
jgi:prepilin-type processing-associated H-X9-DG protein